MIHFLQVHGIVDAVLKAAAVALAGWVLRAARRHAHLLREIRDLLRTDTPGGNADVLHAIERLERKPPRPRAKSAKPPASRE